MALTPEGDHQANQHVAQVPLYRRILELSAAATVSTFQEGLPSRDGTHAAHIEQRPSSSLSLSLFVSLLFPFNGNDCLLFDCKQTSQSCLDCFSFFLPFFPSFFASFFRMSVVFSRVRSDVLLIIIIT